MINRDYFNESVSSVLAAVVVLISGVPFPLASLNRGVVDDDKTPKWASHGD